MSSIAVGMMSAAIFARRSRSGWRDELDAVRREALADPFGEVDVAMANAGAMPEHEADAPSPVAVLERGQPDL